MGVIIMGIAIKNEIYKMYKNKFLWVGMLITFFIMVGELSFSYTQFYNMNKVAELYENGKHYPFVLSRFWIGGDLASVYNKIYYLLLPIFAVLPFSVTYYIEIRTGYIKNICIRIKKKHYIFAKYIVAFIGGGLGVSIPLLFNLWTSALYSVNYPQAVTLMITPIGNKSLFADIFFEKPLLYILIYTGIAFVYGGIFAVMSMAVVYLCKNIFVYVTFPFIMNMSAYYILLNTSAIKFVPIAFINPLQMICDSNGYAILIVFFLMLIISIAAMIYHIKKDILN